MFMAMCNLSPPRLPKIHDQHSLTLRWRWFSGCGSALVCVHFDHQGGQCIENKLWCTNINILRLSVEYLNATINVKPKMLNRRLEPTGLAKLGKTRGLTGTGLVWPAKKQQIGLLCSFWPGPGPSVQFQPGTVANTKNLSNPVHLTLPKSKQRTSIDNMNINRRHVFRTLSRRASDCILLGWVLLLPGTPRIASSSTECYVVALFSCYSTKLHTISTLIYFCLHSPTSLHLHQHGTYGQPGEESRFTEESRSPPWESTWMGIEQN